MNPFVKASVLTDSTNTWPRRPLLLWNCLYFRMLRCWRLYRLNFQECNSSEMMYWNSLVKTCEAFNAKIRQRLPEILVYFLFVYTISTWEVWSPVRFKFILTGVEWNWIWHNLLACFGYSCCKGIEQVTVWLKCSTIPIWNTFLQLLVAILYKYFIIETRSIASCVCQVHVYVYYIGAFRTKKNPVF